MADENDRQSDSETEGGGTSRTGQTPHSSQSDEKPEGTRIGTKADIRVGDAQSGEEEQTPRDKTRDGT